MSATDIPAVVLLHGLGADRRAFQRFERLLPSEWHARSLDLLGHGDAPQPETGYGLERHAAHVVSELDASSAQAPVVVVGHSYGAATATALAALHPGRVRGIVLLDPVVGLSVERIGSKTAQMVAARRAGTLEQVVPELFPESSAALQRWTIDTWERMHLGVVEELDADWTRFAEWVTCPVAIIHGDIELGGAGDLAADWFDDPLVLRIAGAGHYLHATHARETAAAVVRAVAPIQS